MVMYSDEVKQAMVKKICSPGGTSVYQLAKETGISKTALFSWVKSFGETLPSRAPRLSKDWPMSEKLKIVFEYDGLTESEQGAFLRKHGLHTPQIEHWKLELAEFENLSKRKVGRPRKDPELVQALEKIKQLERALRRQEKALAEQTALLILQKKMDDLWSRQEDEE